MKTEEQRQKEAAYHRNYRIQNRDRIKENFIRHFVRQSNDKYLDPEKVKELAADGFEYFEIARMLDVTRKAVKAALND